MKIPAAVIMLCLVLAFPMLASRPSAAASQPPEDSSLYFNISRCRVVRSYPHDPRAFTQGLVYDGVDLFESTGLYGQSSIRKVELATGRILEQMRLPMNFFGEGVTLWENTLTQLTWKKRIGFIFAKDGFALKGQFRYDTEGWGITNDGHFLIYSDGTATLRFLDPSTFKTKRSFVVVSRGRKVDNLNELEYIRGEIWANVFPTSWIVRISPIDGSVIGWIDCEDLCARVGRCHEDDVLNGIAYDSWNDRIYVTGKLWPQLFEITLDEPQPDPR